MQEAILNKHGKQEAPPIYHRGSYPIDAIFVTKALKIDKCGYLGFGRLPTDHRGLWIQVTYKSAFGNIIYQHLSDHKREDYSANGLKPKNCG